MGGTPLFALALVGMPIDRLPVATIRKILEGGESVCATRRHSDRRRPHDRLGRADLRPRRRSVSSIPSNLKRNAGAKPGDALVLGKPLGVGIYSAALKKGQLAARALRGDDRERHAAQHAGHRRWARWTTVHALTDVTGFGLARPPARDLPRIGRGRHRRVRAHSAPAGRAASSRAPAFVTGASARNWSGYKDDVTLGPGDDRDRARARDRSANVGRPARGLRGRRGRRRARAVPYRGLRACSAHRLDRRRRAANRVALTRDAGVPRGPRPGPRPLSGCRFSCHHRESGRGAPPAGRVVFPRRDDRRPDAAAHRSHRSRLACVPKPIFAHGSQRRPAAHLPATTRLSSGSHRPPRSWARESISMRARP